MKLQPKTTSYRILFIEHENWLLKVFTGNIQISIEKSMKMITPEDDIFYSIPVSIDNNTLLLRRRDIEGNVF